MIRSKSRSKFRLGGALCALLALVMLFSLTACGEPACQITEEEAREILTSLLPDSQKVLRILWGNELPLEDPDAEPVPGVTAAQYYPVDPASPYCTEAAVRAYVLSVYTEEYAAQLFQMAFEGYQISYEVPSTGVSGDGEESTETKVDTYYPRFREEKGVLCNDITFDTSRYHLDAEVDVSQATIVSRAPHRVTAEVDCTLNGTVHKMRLILVETESGWRLDSPTY